ncbi:MAG: carbohydrate kinase family protein [Ignisphaera sp.]
MSLHNYWPFILLMPSDIDKRVTFLQTLFSSPTIFEVLTLFDKTEEICQKDIVTILKHHSNKTVISVLKKLVRLGLLEEIQRVLSSRNRVARMKCYRLTELGKWYNIFLKDVKTLDRNILRKLLEEITLLFVDKVMSLRDDLAMKHAEIINVLILNILKSVARNKKNRSSPEVVIFGSIAFDIYLEKDKLMFFSGGSGANTAFNCAKWGLSTTFITRIPVNMLGLKLVVELVDYGVDLSLSQVDPKAKATLCVIREWYTDDPEIVCNYDTINPPVITKLNNNIISLCNEVKAVYLGEGICSLFIELLNSIDRNNKIIIYRPSSESLKKYFNECKDVLKYNPILILNSKKYKILRDKGLDIPYDLFKLGVERIIVTKGSRGVSVYTFEPRETIDISVKQKVDVVDTVGAGDVFTATLLHQLLQGKNIITASQYAVEVATQSISILGPRKIDKLPRNQDIISLIS